LTTLAQCVGEETDTIEDAYEPYLLQCGLILRTARGRVPTPRAWAHLGQLPPRDRPSRSGDTVRALIDARRARLLHPFDDR